MVPKESAEQTAHRFALLPAIAGGGAIVVAAAAVAMWFASHGKCMAEEPQATEQATEQAKTEHQHTNALIRETSPYLLQHAHNPVHWYPWGDEAFELARQQNKPIFLSVGYSTCYWCHVMERESFEDEEVAEVINEHFIAIKVDREERPDIDEQYMFATQLMTGRGGWPNSLWLTPDGRPWMAGTYFPKDRFVPLLERLAELWTNQPDAVEQQAQALSRAIARAASGAAGALGAEQSELNRQLVDDALAKIKSRFDPTNAGFGGAPKFPPHGELRILGREALHSEDPELQAMLVQTLDAMWQGGIHDHVGGGFHRYATDAKWFLPHFEKMLYDNAQLIRAYTDGYRVSGDRRYADAVEDIFQWVQREMTDPQGAYYSALDSESDGEEGRFYVWTLDELQEVLSDEEASLFAEVYGFEPDGNFTEEATGERPGTNIPYLPLPLDELARQQEREREELETQLSAIREKLLAARNHRPFPHRDDKILASWNGLMISALAYAGDHLDEPRYTESAQRAAEFILENMQRDGELLRTYRVDRARVPGYLDDYAFMVRGLLELHTSTGQPRWREESQRLADGMIANFEDAENGGFYFTSEQHQELLVRSKNLSGGGNLPSANGVAAEVLVRLGEITEEPRYRQAGRETLESLAALMALAPEQADSMIYATAILLDDASESQPSATVAAERGDDAQKTAVAVHRLDAITARAYLSKQAIGPGERLEVSVSFDIQPGWHLYGPNPDAEFLVPTTIALQPNEMLTAGELQLPKGITKEDPVLGQTLMLYEDRVWFRLPVTVAENAAAGETELELQIRVQACDENRCLPARDAILKLPLRIADEASPDS